MALNNTSIDRVLLQAMNKITKQAITYVIDHIPYFSPDDAIGN